MEVLIRYAKHDDYSQIINILNQAIRSKKSTGYLNEFTSESRKDWFQFHMNEKYPILVAELNNEISGWISLSPYRKERKAFERTAEVSFFIHQDYQRKGLGTKLLLEMMNVAKRLGFSSMFAIVLEINTASIKLLKTNNFKKWAYLPGVAEIECETISHVYYGIQL